MSSSTIPLEVHVHLKDGNVCKFVQSNRETAEQLAASIDPARFFSQKDVVIAGEQSMSVFATQSIVRVDLLGETIPAWPYLFTAKRIVEITAEEFRQRYEQSPYHSRSEMRAEVGHDATVFSEIELGNYERLFFEVRVTVQEMTPLDRAVFLQQLFGAPALHAERRDGGRMLLNTHHIHRITFYPGPSETPRGALCADLLPG